MLAKAILPWFGGVASVWIVAMLFFQGMLLVGYGYAYLISRFLSARVQPLCHIALLMGSLMLMPLSPWRAWQAGAQGDPPMQILRILFLSVGLPYFLLSSTGPLIQAWYAQAQRVAFPYRLFALSNLGSLTALLAYPVAVEPFLTTRHQTVVWSMLYGVFVLLCTATAVRFLRSRSPASDSAGKVTKQPTTAPGRRDYLLWGAFAACGSALLITVMNHLCQNLVPIPLLWVLPLATYLLTFILCFDRQGWYRPALVRWLLPIALGAMMYGVFDPVLLQAGAMSQILLYLGCLFVGCLFCHGELARRKPHSVYLTSFYLMIALGGAMASIVIGLVAPRVSTWQVEFPETIVGCGILGLSVLYPKCWTRRAIVVALAVVLVLLGAGLIRGKRKGVILQARSFYGALTVTEGNEDLEDHRYMLRTLFHGWIRHGTQLVGPQLETYPTSYYGPKSGVGLLLSTPRNSWNVGIVGLGAGTLAAYGKRLDEFTFYEIDPLVSRVANSKFSFLKLSLATVKIVIGDGRLSLEKEPPQKFDLLVIDAFSGDAIPTHLLTREAFELYFSKLKAGGAIAVHISNRYVDLMPVLAEVSATLDKPAILVKSYLNDTSAALASDWVLVANNLVAFRDMPRASWSALPRSPGFEVWTDDYSNVLQLLK